MGNLLRSTFGPYVGISAPTTAALLNQRNAAVPQANSRVLSARLGRKGSGKNCHVGIVHDPEPKDAFPGSGGVGRSGSSSCPSRRDDSHVRCKPAQVASDIPRT